MQFLVLVILWEVAVQSMILIRTIKDATMRIIISMIFMTVPILNIHVVIIHTLACIIGYNHAVQENGLYNSS